MGYVQSSNGLLWGIVACHFGLLGFPGRVWESAKQVGCTQLCHGFLNMDFGVNVGTQRVGSRQLQCVQRTSKQS